jgi:hypothetical protein
MILPNPKTALSNEIREIIVLLIRELDNKVTKEFGLDLENSSIAKYKVLQPFKSTKLSAKTRLPQKAGRGGGGLSTLPLL